MQKKRFLFTVLFLICAFGLIVPATYARVISQNNTYTLQEDETVDDDLFVTAETINILGTVKGDVYAAGETLIITGVVQGDVYGMASIIKLSGTVDDDVRVTGGTIDISNANVGDSVAVLGGTANIESTDIAGNLMFAGGTINTDATVGRGMYGAAGTFDFNGVVGKDAWIGAGLLSAGTDAVIKGNLTYSTETQGDLPENLRVDGDASYVDPSEHERTGNLSDAVVGGKIVGTVGIGFLLWVYSSSLLIGLVFLYMFPGVAANVVWTMKNKFVPSIGWGFIVLLVAPWVFALLTFTVVGVPFAFLLVGLLVLEIFFAHLFVGMAYGSFISENLLKTEKSNMYINFAIGLGVYYVIGLIPFINMIQLFGGILVSLGALLTIKRQRFFTSTLQTTEQL